MTTQVWFETHSSTVDNGNRVATGWLPGELSVVGRDQARSLGGRIAVRQPAAILVSDLRRAIDTVRIALDDAGVKVPVVVDRRLRECDYGNLTGADHDLVHGNRLRYLSDPHPGGESWQTAVDRALVAVREAVRQHSGRTIVIVGHVATRLAVERLATSRPLTDILTDDVAWRPGWSYQLSASQD